MFDEIWEVNEKNFMLLLNRVFRPSFRFISLFVSRAMPSGDVTTERKSFSLSLSRSTCVPHKKKWVLRSTFLHLYKHFRRSRNTFFNMFWWYCQSLCHYHLWDSITCDSSKISLNECDRTFVDFSDSNIKLSPNNRQLVLSFEQSACIASGCSPLRKR